RRAPRGSSAPRRPLRAAGARVLRAGGRGLRATLRRARRPLRPHRRIARTRGRRGADRRRAQSARLVMDAVLLPWLEHPLAQALAAVRGHALLVHGPQGVGQFEFAQAMAAAWLCETPQASRRHGMACGECASCQLVRARTHPDLLVLLPEALQEALGFADGTESESADGKKAKPSREIKVDALRSAVAFAQQTSARGVAKVVVLHPAERMNAISANTLLKTLEEPPGAARFLLSCAAPEALLPTIRSRCQSTRLALPAPDEALAWL